MTSNRCFLACCFGLAAWLWCVASASAHESQAKSRSDGTGGRLELSNEIPWDTIEWNGAAVQDRGDRVQSAK